MTEAHAKEGMTLRFAKKEFIMYAGSTTSGIRPLKVSKVASVVYLLNTSKISLVDLISGLFDLLEFNLKISSNRCHFDFSYSYSFGTHFFFQTFRTFPYIPKLFSIW